MAAIQRVTISISNNFFIWQRILPRLSLNFGFILLCTFLAVGLVGFFRATSLEMRIWIAEFFEFYTLRTHGMLTMFSALAHRMLRDHG